MLVVGFNLCLISDNDQGYVLIPLNLYKTKLAVYRGDFGLYMCYEYKAVTETKTFFVESINMRNCKTRACE